MRVTATLATPNLLVQMLIGSMRNFTYLVGDEETKLGAVVDPAGEVNEILSVVEGYGIELVYVIDTHTHMDHILGNAELSRVTGAEIVAHRSATISRNLSVNDGDKIKIGSIEADVIHTPGHSPDSICICVDNILLTGDTLFVGECGRTDLPGGSSVQLYRSLSRLKKLDDNLMVFPGHDYGDRPYSTLGFEKAHNYTLKPRSEEEFVRFMQT